MIALASGFDLYGGLFLVVASIVALAYCSTLDKRDDL